MKLRRFLWVLLVAAVFLGSLGVPAANAQRRVFYASSPSMTYYPPVVGYGMTPMYYAPSAMYVAPLPGYGILPPPFISMQMLQGYYGYDSHQRTAEVYGADVYDGPARKRAALYPAVPFEKTAQDRLADLQRVRFEVTVPYADAVVTFDGAKTKQTGMTRIFVTPAMEEGKEYTVTIDAQWRKQDGSLSAPRPKTFTVTPGETVRHTFIE